MSKNLSQKKKNSKTLFISCSNFEVYGIEKQLQDLFGETVPISNGGYVIIQHTEALHAIDVNSGKTSKAANQEESA